MRATKREAVPLLDRMEDKDRRTVEQIGRLMRLHNVLKIEARRLRSGEAEEIVQARLSSMQVRV